MLDQHFCEWPQDSILGINSHIKMDTGIKNVWWATWISRYEAEKWDSEVDSLLCCLWIDLPILHSVLNSLMVFIAKVPVINLEIFQKGLSSSWRKRLSKVIHHHGYMIPLGSGLPIFPNMYHLSENNCRRESTFMLPVFLMDILGANSNY